MSERTSEKKSQDQELVEEVSACQKRNTSSPNYRS